MSGKILVVDDDPEVRMTTRDFLASRGHAVSVAAGGRANGCRCAPAREQISRWPGGRRVIPENNVLVPGTKP